MHITICPIEAEGGNREKSQQTMAENGDDQDVQTHSPDNFLNDCFLTRRSRLRESQDTGYISRKQSMDTQDGRDTALDLVDDTDATHAPGKCGSPMAYVSLCIVSNQWTCQM
ncbi:hypothetical protein DPMN_185488 [Dreissena polymorpha]|uniref:Uncharacterized protein n=1 Tax=Dreissena polymorpha TaxID=45954 RepID=A0A9D4DL42_DREPO|nr:hypothetical protein DPMN_185488 [Dreissena polymorpha]